MRPAHRPVIVLTLLCLCFVRLSAPALKAQVSDEEKRKRELFLRARESIEPEPASAPAPAPVRPQPRPRPTARAEEAPREDIKLPPPKPAPTPDKPKPRPAPKQTPPPKPKATPAINEAVPLVVDEPDDLVLSPAREEATPVIKAPPREKTQEDIIKLPPPRPSESAAASPAPAAGEAPEAQIVVEKSGLEEDQGLVPPPPPERGGFLGLGGPRYRYLTRPVRAAIDRAPVKRGRWQYIVVHNSGTRQGNARIFDHYHKNVRRMENGLAYHFVIGNGTSSGDGEIEIGPRWTRQINGGHVASDYLNNIALGICFVGDFNRDTPTTAQLGALEELIRYLRSRVGRSKGRAVIVKAHREINPKPTDCPGNRFPYRWLHRRFD
ncbi:MAG: N-acetylmuramoyl-L-alanine amidase [Chthoniobacterales bacterium]|nr:N-acetylmuramoyl-L-alanine amidase [Chthoniobacterales bacterium]